MELGPIPQGSGAAWGVFPAVTEHTSLPLSFNSRFGGTQVCRLVCVCMVERLLNREGSGPATSGRFGLASCLKGSMKTPHLLRGGGVRADERAEGCHAKSRVALCEDKVYEDLTRDSGKGVECFCFT